MNDGTGASRHFCCKVRQENKTERDWKNDSILFEQSEEVNLKVHHF
jgi:hypothetical protein